MSVLPPEASDHADDLLAYLAASPSPYHAVANAAARLEAAGFTALDPAATWPGGPGRYLVARGGSLIAWVVPEGAAPDTAFRLVGAHTDSPNLRVKPQPDIRRAGYRQLGVEVYGGALYNSWLDRDLGLSGRVALRSPGGNVTRLVHTDEPVARIPQLAIHLDRGVNDGLKLNPQHHLTPLWSTTNWPPLSAPQGTARSPESPRGSTTDDGGFAGFIAGLLSGDTGAARHADDVVAWDLMFHDVAPPALVGRDRDLVSSGRIDNLLSCHAGVVALTEASVQVTNVVPALTLFDHEEVGSQTATGAQGAWLAHALERIALARGATRADFLASLAGSVCVSADGAHATNPNYVERHDPEHLIRLDGGPVVKFNANQRYATDTDTAAWLADAFARAEVPLQRFVSRSDMPCGSTIGPLTAAGLAVATVDVGAPMLSMHAARELTSALDAWRLARVLAAAFTTPDGHGRGAHG